MSQTQPVGAEARRLRRPGPAVHGRPPRLRALRDLPAAVPDLPGPRRGDGLAAGPGLSHARGRRGPDRAHAHHGAAPRSLPRLPGLRDGLPLRRAVRPAPRGRPGAVRAPRRHGAHARQRHAAASSSGPSRIPRGSAPCSARSACTSGPACRRWCAALGLLAPFKKLRAMEALLPRVPRPGAPLPELIPARGPRRGRAGLLLGCAQRFFYPDVNADTARLLSAAGYDVVVPRAQACCGALHLHAGRLDEFRAMARRLMPVFADVDVVVVNAAGCGSALKEYGHWLPDDAARALRRARAGRLRGAGRLRAAAARAAADRDLSRRLPSGARPEGPRAAARAAAPHPRPHAGGPGGLRALLRERGGLQSARARDGGSSSAVRRSAASARPAPGWSPRAIPAA